MDLEAIAYILAGIPVVAKFLSNQAKFTEAAEHLAKQNCDILSRQQKLLEGLTEVVLDTRARVEALEDSADGEVEVRGFRAEGEEEDEEEEVEEGEVNRKVVGFRRTWRR